jgi:photosystem II stability/assembly factor-like uncharacterized protein
VSSPPFALSDATDRVGDVSTVRFANLNDGWAFKPQLWATHDGGVRWQRVTVPGLAPDASFWALEAASGSVHAAILDSSFRIATTPVGSDSWKLSATSVEMGAGPVPEAQIVLHGPDGWMLENDRVVVGGAQLRDGRWLPWNPPCMNIGGSAQLAASSSTNLVIVCHEGVWSGPPERIRAYVSSDGGKDFQWTKSELPIEASGEVATPTRATAVVTGITNESLPVLIATFDQGRHWSTVYRGTVSGASLSGVGFTTAVQGFVIEAPPDHRTGRLLMSIDGGRTWAPRSLAPGTP